MASLPAMSSPCACAWFFCRTSLNVAHVDLLVHFAVVQNVPVSVIKDMIASKFYC
jgi:hypothetical protein